MRLEALIGDWRDRQIYWDPKHAGYEQNSVIDPRERTPIDYRLRDFVLREEQLLDTRE